MRDRLSDLSRDELPSVEQAQDFVRDQSREMERHRLQSELAELEKLQGDRATVRDEIQWEEALAKAAIAKEQKEGQFRGAVP